MEDNGYQAPAKDGSAVEVEVDPASKRLQLLTPFAPWDGEDLKGLKLLIKAKGQMYDRSHLHGRTVAALQGAPG